MVLPATGHLHFLLTVPRICTDNDAPQMTPLCFHCPEMRDAFSSPTAAKALSLYVSFPPRAILLLRLSAPASSKCHYVQVSSPAIRDRLTFYCEVGLFSRHLLCHNLLVGCFIVVVNVSVPAQGRHLYSPAHFSFSDFSQACPGQTWLFPCCGRHGTIASCRFRACQVQTERECQVLVVRVISTFLPMPCCYNMHN